MQNIFVLLFTNIGVGTFNYIYLFNMDCFNPYIGLEFLFLTCLGLDILNLFNILDLFDLLDNLDFDLGYSDSESFDSESEYEWPSDSEDWSSEGEDWDDWDDNKPVPVIAKPVAPVLPEVTKPEPADAGNNSDK